MPGRSLLIALTSFVLAVAASGGEVVVPERPSLEQRLAEDWRWRELVLPNDAEALEFIGVQGRRITAIVDGRLVQHHGLWRPVLEAPADEVWRAAAPCGEGLLLQGERGLAYVSPDGSVRPVLAADGHRVFSDVLMPRGDGSLVVIDRDAFVVIRDGELAGSTPAPGLHFFTGSAEDAAGRLIVCIDDGLWIEDRAGGWERLPGSEPLAGRDRRYGLLRQGDDVLFVPSRQMAAAPVMRWDGERLVEEGEPVTGGDAALVEGRVLVTDWVDGVSVQQADGSWLRISPPARVGERLLSLRALGDGRLLVVSATGRAWVCDLPSRRWRLFEVPNGDASSSVNALSRARDGGLWVGTGAGLLTFDDGEFRRVGEGDVPGWLPQITSVHEDRAGRVWVSSGSGFEGVVVGEGGVWRRVEEPFGGGHVHQVRESSDGSVWFLLLGPAYPGPEPSGGLVALRPDGRWQRWGLAEGLPHERCYDLAELPDGRLVVATLTGLGVLDGDRWQRWDGFTGPARSLLVARDGSLWAARGLNVEGVERWHDDRWTELDPRLDGLFVGALADGPDGSVWVSSPSGLFLHDDLGLHPAGAEPDRPVRSFWPLLPDDEGVWLGGLESGLVRFTPEDTDTPRVVELHVEPSGDGWHVRWAAVDPEEHTEAEALRYRWRLDGGPWTRVGGDHTVHLDRQAPGTHVFELMVLDRRGNMSVSASAPFEVLPAWWRRPGVWAVGGLLLIVLGWGGVSVARWRGEVRRNRRRVADNEQHFRQIVREVGALFARFDADGQLVWCDPSFARMVGRPELDALPRLLGDAAQGEACRNMITAARHDRPGEAEFSLPDTTGLPRWFLAHLVPRPEAHGAGGGFDLAALDVTERRLAGQRRQELATWRRQMERMEAVGHLAAGIAHDFNNLLTAILGHQALLLRDLDKAGGEPELIEHAEAIDEAARKAAVLTSRLLRFSRREPASRQHVDVAECLDGLSRVLRRVVREDVRLVWDVPSGLPPVWIDPSELEQVVMNLIVNGQDAITGEGTIEVVGVATPDDELCLRVRDSGMGMDAATQRRIFDPFFTTKELGAGTGLGLATVQRIVADAGGRVGVESEVGRGTTFVITFPVAPEGGAPPERPESAPRGGDETLVLCEDDVAVRGLVATLLSSNGYTVLESASGDEALAHVAERPDVRLLVTDVVMPGRSGPEVVAAARELRADLPVLYVSGYPAHLLDGKLGDDDLLFKPFTEGELLGRVRLALDGRAASEEVVGA